MKSTSFTCAYLLALTIVTNTSIAQESQSVPATNTTANAAPAPSNSNKSGDDEGIYRHTRFGLRITPAYNSFNVLSKTMSSGGGTIKFGGGLLIETQLTKNVAFQTGIGVDVFGGSITYSNNPDGKPESFTNRFLYNGPDEAIEKYEVTDRNKTGYTEFMLLERNYKMTYITAPVNLRMKTNKMAGFKYFGQLGLDFQFRWSSFASDRVQQITTFDNSSTMPIELGPAQDVSKVNINGDVSFFNMTVNTGLGIEREVGGVDLFVSFNYHFGVFSPVDKESVYTQKVYQTSPGVLEASKLKQDYRTRSFALTLGFMF